MALYTKYNKNKSRSFDFYKFENEYYLTTYKHTFFGAIGYPVDYIKCKTKSEAYIKGNKFLNE